MGSTVPFAEYAIQKVLTFLPPCKEKSTLLAIASCLNYRSGTAFPSHRVIAQRSGNGVATVKRHIEQLVKDGHLQLESCGRQGRKSNVYSIPCCKFSVAELEFMTGVDGKQLLLGVFEQETKGELTVGERLWKGIVSEGSSSDWATTSLNMSYQVAQNELLTTIQHEDNKEPGLFQKENGGMVLMKKAEKAIIKQKRMDIAEENRRIRESELATVDPASIIAEVNPELANLLRKAVETTNMQRAIPRQSTGGGLYFKPDEERTPSAEVLLRRQLEGYDGPPPPDRPV